MRLEIEKSAPPRSGATAHVRARASTSEDVYLIDGPLSLKPFMHARRRQIDRPDLKEPVFPPVPTSLRRRRRRAYSGASRAATSSPPPLRVVRHRGGVPRSRGRRPRRARDQADALPHERRLAHRQGAGARGAQRQAGHRARRAQGALRRGDQYRMGARRSKRPARTSSTASSASRRTARRRSSCAASAGGIKRYVHLSHRQLQRDDGARLHRRRATSPPTRTSARTPRPSSTSSPATASRRASASSSVAPHRAARTASSSSSTAKRDRAPVRRQPAA